ncbi:putative Ig domain-containing protein, partial [Granulicella sp. L60]|uniref:putative Ig domain-containing protein n=1 Tax=Granulicella sp. L60 TaxID=1641866 RepID=UPI0020B15C48
MLKRSLCPLAPLFLCLLLAGCASNTSPVTSPVAPPDTPNTPVTPVSITTKTLPYADLDTPYRVNLQATNGFQPYTFSLAEGSTLPTGFTLSPTGSLSGLPTTPGTFPFVAQVADASTPQNLATQAFSLTIGPPLTVVASTLPPATVGSPYNNAIQIAGGTLPYTFTPFGSSLPTGLTLSTTGVLSG